MKHLVLDLGGVMAEEPMGVVFDLLAQSGKKNSVEIEAFYREEIRDDLWTGEIEEDSFWQKICAFADVEGMEEEARDTLLETLSLRFPQKPSYWSKKASLYILSNHRENWALPLVDEMGKDNFTEVWISEKTGNKKPDKEAFAPLLDLEGEVLFIDDKKQNIDAASALGIPALLADEDNLWVYDTEQWLGFLPTL